MDYKTLIISVLVVALGSSVGMAVIFWTRRTYSGFGYWVGGTTCRVMAGLLFLLPRDVYPAWLTIAVANFMIIAETMCYIRGTLLFRGRPLHPRIDLCVVVAFAALFAYYIYIEPMMNMRIMFRLTFNGALELWLMGILLSKRPAYFGIGEIWQAVLWGLLSVFSFGLALYSYGNVPPVPDITVLINPVSQQVYLLVLLPCAFMTTMSQIIMNAQRFEYDHRKLQDQLEEDVASLKEMHDRLQMSEARHRMLVDNSTDIIWTMTLDGRVTYVNAAVERLRGFSPEEFLSQSRNELYVPEFQTMFKEGVAIIQEQMKAGTPIKLPRREIQAPCKDGSRIWMEVSATGIYDAQGHFVELMGTSRDISDRKRGEAQKDELLNLNHRLQKNESLMRMAGAVAHHFNNKLQGVTGNLEVALSGLDEESPPEELRKSMTAAMEAASRAVEVSTMMLTYLGDVRSNPQRIDLAAFCSGVLTSLKSEKPTNVEMKVDLQKANLLVKLDPRQLEQIIGNLVRNAWEASGKRLNTVEVAVGKVKVEAIPPTIRFPADFKPRVEDYVFIKVSDTGIGIDPSHFEKIGDPFYTTKFTGRRIGLPVVLGIVRAQGGVMTVKSQLGEGSEFSVFLPAVDCRDV